MVTLECTLCGHQLEVNEELEPGQPVSCPHCGQITAARPVAPKSDHSSIVDIEQAVVAGDAPEPAASVTDLTKVHAGAVPPPRKPVTAGAYEFLDPPQAPGELGRLGRYRVLRLLGKGGMGIVFTAEDVDLQRAVALKVMSPALAEVEVFRQRFLREARAMASVNSEYIVNVHEVSQTRNLPYLAMELLQGERLDLWLQRAPRPSVEQVARIGTQVARGLAAAHEKGLVHRDIKPSNVWLDTKGGRVKILDFGLARVANEETNLTQAGMMMGTPAYMAPEQAEAEPVDARCDLFSLGCVLYQMATGQLPFTGNSTMSILKAVALKDPIPPCDIDPALPAALTDLIMHLLAKRPADRPASALIVVERLQAILGELGAAGSGIFGEVGPVGPSTPTPAPTPERIMRSLASKPPRQFRPAVLLGGLAALVLVLGGLFWWLHGPGASGPREDIFFGISAPFQGPSAELGRGMEEGIQTYFAHINAQGGVKGRRLKLVALDDGYEPDRALANMRELHDKYKVLGVIGNVGTPTAEVTVPYAIEKKMLFFGAFTGAGVLRETPPARYVFNYRASYLEETAAIVRYLRKTRHLPAEAIAVFAQKDSYGDAGFEGVKKGLSDEVAAEAILRVGYKRNSPDVEDEVDEAAGTILASKKTHAVVMVGTYRPSARFIRTIKDAKREMIFANVSFVGSEALAGELGPRYADGVIITQVVPRPQSPATAIVEYRERLATYFPHAGPNFISLEGYIAASILVEGLKGAKREVTTETVVQALESINHLDLGIGPIIHFGPSRHQGSDQVWGTMLDKQGQIQLLKLD